LYVIESRKIHTIYSTVKVFFSDNDDVRSKKQTNNGFSQASKQQSVCRVAEGKQACKQEESILLLYGSY